MEKPKSGVEFLLGVAFKIGFLVIIVGMFMFFSTNLGLTLDLTLDYMGFWAFLGEQPAYIQLIFVGLALVAVAVAVGACREQVENMVNILFGKEEHF